MAYLKVDLKQKYYVRALAVKGFPDGTHKPGGKWYLEGSNDGTVMARIAEADKWYTPGTYPLVKSQIAECIYPRKHRYYHIYGEHWTDEMMLIMNLGLFT